MTGNFTRNEIKVALIIARFTISFRRDFAPLSKKVLERQTGLRGAAILEAVAGLVKKGLVQKQQGNQYRPNMLGLVLPEAWDGPDKPTKKQFNSQVFPPQESPFEKVQKSTHPVVENVNYPQVGRMTQGEVSNPTPFKDIKIYKNNNSLSSLPKSLEDYFQNLKPIKKRESERKAFEELIQDYQASEIVDCLALLKKRGVKIGQMGEFQVCHSPMAYLSKAMNEVLEEVSRSRTVKSLNETRLAREAQQKTEEEELKKLETQQWQAKTQAFERAYPSLEKQQEIINQFCRNKFNPTQVPGRIYAISEWWRTIDVQNAQVATC